jgi:uncharacterized SAM-binding protein YcdF (DUF218 family)
MFFIVSKVLAVLASPFTWILLLLICAWVVKKYRKQLLLVALATLYLFSNEFLFCEAMRAWEILPKKKTEIKQTYVYGIVLGGFASYDMAYDRVGFHESSDRLFIALELYKAGTIKKIVISGGSASLRKPFIKEAEVVRNYLLKIGIPSDDIVVESESKNTYQNAVNTGKILSRYNENGPHLLITSGYHMRRAMGCFNKAGISVSDFSVDRVAGPRKWHFEHLLIPNVYTLNSWNILFHEWIGYLSYWLKGYL